MGMWIELIATYPDQAENGNSSPTASIKGRTYHPDPVQDEVDPDQDYDCP